MWLVGAHRGEWKSLGFSLIPSKDWGFAQLLPEELGFISPRELSARRSPSISLGLVWLLLLHRPS